MRDRLGAQINTQESPHNETGDAPRLSAHPRSRRGGNTAWLAASASAAAAAVALAAAVAASVIAALSAAAAVALVTPASVR